MEKLDKVIAGLKGCRAAICSNCEYFDPSKNTACTERLMEDALNLIEHLRAENQGVRNMWADAVLELDRVQHERDFWASLDRKE